MKYWKYIGEYTSLPGPGPWLSDAIKILGLDGACKLHDQSGTHPDRLLVNAQLFVQEEIK